jgi:hypothetical protein
MSSGNRMVRVPKAIFLVHVAATLLMTGAIWFIQVAHYPLFDRVPPAAFMVYEATHIRLTTLVVIPLMGAEAITGTWLLWRRPAAIPIALIWIGLALLAIIWVSTAFLQVPQHEILSGGFDVSAHRTLVASNWIRTLAWSARSLLVLRMALLTMEHP